MNKRGIKCLVLLCAALGLLSLSACGKKQEASETEKIEAETWGALDENSPTVQSEPYPLLQEICREHLADGWGQTPPSAFGLSNALADTDRPWGYAVLDLDGDGTEEMIIGWNQEGRARLVNVFTLDAEGMLDTRFCSDGIQLLSITEEGEWIMWDGEQDRIPEESSPTESSSSEELPEKTAQNGEGWEPQTEAPRDIRWKTIELTALH